MFSHKILTAYIPTYKVKNLQCRYIFKYRCIVNSYSLNIEHTYAIPSIRFLHCRNNRLYNVSILNKFIQLQAPSFFHNDLNESTNRNEFIQQLGIHIQSKIPPVNFLLKNVVYSQCAYIEQEPSTNYYTQLSQ